jgi:S1-C subfamily serine protease
MKTSLRHVVPLLALFMLVPCSGAATPAPAQPLGWLGLLLADATQTSPKQRGALVRGVVEGGPADQGRLRARDSIVAVNAIPVGSAAELLAQVKELDPGSIVTLSVNRRGRDLELRTVLGMRPERTEPRRMVRGWLGVDAIELPASLRAHFGAPEDAGVLVSGVIGGSPAELSGIRVGDVIFEADGQPVTSAEALTAIVDSAGAENSIDVVLGRDGARIVVEPLIERRP